MQAIHEKYAETSTQISLMKHLTKKKTSKNIYPHIIVTTFFLAIKKNVVTLHTYFDAEWLNRL